MIFEQNLQKSSNIESEPHQKLLHIQISLGTKFRLNLTLLIFWTKLTQKGYFRSKERGNCHRILHIRIILGSKFQFIQTILIFETNF